MSMVVDRGKSGAERLVETIQELPPMERFGLRRKSRAERLMAKIQELPPAATNRAGRCGDRASWSVSPTWRASGCSSLPRSWRTSSRRRRTRSRTPRRISPRPHESAPATRGLPRGRPQADLASPCAPPSAAQDPAMTPLLERADHLARSASTLAARWRARPLSRSAGAASASPRSPALPDEQQGGVTVLWRLRRLFTPQPLAPLADLGLAAEGARRDVSLPPRRADARPMLVVFEDSTGPTRRRSTCSST